MLKRRRVRNATVALAILAVGFSGPALADDPLTLATRVADWQLARAADHTITYRFNQQTYDPIAWEQGAFWVGLSALADHLPADRHFRDTILAMGRANGWKPGPRPFHADDLVISQTYIWASRHGAGAPALAPTRARLDQVLATQPRVGLAFYDGQPKQPVKEVECQARWCWSDALFMAPASWAGLAQATGDVRYRRHALDEYWATVNFLYDPTEKLFYRDSRFFERRDDQGRKLFWSRGNGWVFAGLARLIPLVPAHSPDRERLEALFREMAERMVALQKPDGYWAPSLLAPENSPPESSGTAFFTYGLAWGVNAGLLDRARFEPAARKGWDALVRAIQPDGRLGWVQQVGDQPDKVDPADTQFYGSGAFLLAATAIADLDSARHK